MIEKVKYFSAKIMEDGSSIIRLIEESVLFPLRPLYNRSANVNSCRLLFLRRWMMLLFDVFAVFSVFLLNTKREQCLWKSFHFWRYLWSSRIRLLENVFKGTVSFFRFRSNSGTNSSWGILDRGRLHRREFHSIVCALCARRKKRCSMEPSQIDGIFYGFQVQYRNPHYSVESRSNHRILQWSQTFSYQCKIVPISFIQIFRCYFDMKEGALSPEAISSLFSLLPNSEPLWEHLQTPHYPLLSPDSLFILECLRDSRGTVEPMRTATSPSRGGHRSGSYCFAVMWRKRSAGWFCWAGMRKCVYCTS